MKYLICFLLLIPGIAIAQISVKGVVTGKENKPVEKATVQIAGTSTTSTDEQGNFAFQLSAKPGDTLRLAVSAVEYIRLDTVLVLKQTTTIVRLSLRGKSEQLDNVIVVGAGTFEASDKAKGASLTPMDAVTVAGSNGDIANALRALPGVQQIGETEGLFVRGGTNTEAKQFIDGVLFPSPNYSNVPGIMQPARVNPFLFKGILFNTGGYSAAYGDALSSALILESVDLPEESSASLHLFPTSQGLGFQQLSKNQKSSFGINGRYGGNHFYNQIIKPTVDYTHDPEYITGDANFRLKTSATGILKLYTNFGYNHVGLQYPDLDSVNALAGFRTMGSNWFTNVSYREQLGNRWRLDLSASYTLSNNRTQNSLTDQQGRQLVMKDSFSLKGYGLDREDRFLNGKLVATKSFSHAQAIRMGVEYYRNSFDFYQKWPSAFQQQLFKENAAAVFAESDIRLHRKIAARIGLRSEYTSLLDKINLAPRLSLAYKMDDGGQINLAYGLFYQKPEVEYFLNVSDYGYTKAAHYIINYQKRFSNRLLRIEAFYKKYSDLVTFDAAGGRNGGSGYARGAELFFRDKKSLKNFDYWVSYSFLDTKRKHLNYPGVLAPTFATPHTLSIAAKKYFPAINFNWNASFNFATGRPFYDIAAMENGENYLRAAGETKNFTSLNMSFAYMFSLFKNWKYRDFSGIGFGMNNILGNKPVFGYRFSNDGKSSAPVLLPAPRMVYLGLFITLGVDRREDFLNENL